MAVNPRALGSAGVPPAELRLRASSSESGFTGLAGFSGFRFARLALFAAIGNFAKTDADERLPIKDEIVES